MVKAKEFCCGCSLRTGNLFLAWSTLIVSILSLTSYYQNFAISYRLHDTGPAILYFISFISSILGMLVAPVAIWSIQKKKPAYLNGLLWYFYFVVVILIFFDLVLAVLPVQVQHLIESENELLTIRTKILTQTEVWAAYFLMDFFFIALFLYFVLIVKSYRESMYEDEALENAIELPDQITITYETV